MCSTTAAAQHCNTSSTPWQDSATWAETINIITRLHTQAKNRGKIQPRCGGGKSIKIIMSHLVNIKIADIQMQDAFLDRLEIPDGLEMCYEILHHDRVQCNEFIINNERGNEVEERFLRKVHPRKGIVPTTEKTSCQSMSQGLPNAALPTTYFGYAMAGLRR